MNKYKYSVFNVSPDSSIGFEEMNSKQIAKWLISCRTFITENKSDNRNEYLQEVKNFTDEWYRHYEEYKKSFYDKPKFKTALLSLAVPKAEVMAVISGKNQPVDIFSFQTENTHYPFATEVSEIVEIEDIQKIKEYTKMVVECFSVKNKSQYLYLLDDIIKNHLDKKIAIQIKKLNGKSIKEYKSYEELLKAIEDTKNYKSEIKIITNTRESKYLVKGDTEFTSRLITIGYQEKIKEFGITRSVFTKLINENMREQEFDKKMFINIAYVLSLPFSLLNTFLSYNGYSLDKSTRKFDEIIDRAFKLGFGRDLTIDLIDFYNNELAKKYSKIGYVPIPNLTPNKRNK